MAQNETVVEDSFKSGDFLYELVHTAEGQWKIFCWNTYGKTEEEGSWDCHWEDEHYKDSSDSWRLHTKETARKEFERWRPTHG